MRRAGRISLDWGKLFIWLLIWLGLYTGWYRIAASEFLTSPVVFVDGVRALLPITAGIIAFLLWLRNRSSWRITLTDPLVLLVAYGLVGLVATSYSLDRLASLYWCLTYLAVLVVLAVFRKSLTDIISLNWALVIFGMIFFLVGPLRTQLLNFLFTGRPINVGQLFEIGILGLGVETASGIGRFGALAGILALFRLNDPKLRWFWLVILILALLSLLVSQGRSAMIGFGLGVLVLLLFRERKPWLVLFALSFALFLWIALFQWQWPRLTESGTIEYVARGSMSAVFDDIAGRGATWMQGARLVSERSPLLGLGFNADHIELGRHMHNAFFHALVQAGSLGALFFAAAFICAWIGCIRWVFQSHILQERDRAVEALAVIAFFSFRSIFESTAAFYGVDLILLAPILAQFGSGNATQSI